MTARRPIIAASAAAALVAAAVLITVRLASAASLPLGSSSLLVINSGSTAGQITDPFVTPGPLAGTTTTSGQVWTVPSGSFAGDGEGVVGTKNATNVAVIPVANPASVTVTAVFHPKNPLDIGVVGHSNPTATRYITAVVRHQGSGTLLLRYHNGTQVTTLVTQPVTVTDPMTLTVSVTGTTYTVSVAGSVQFTHTLNASVAASLAGQSMFGMYTSGAGQSIFESINVS